MNKEDVRIVLGENIYTLRKQYAISRTSLAKLTKIPLQRLVRVECGEPNAKLYDIHLHRLAQIFDVTIESLFTRDNEYASSSIACTD